MLGHNRLKAAVGAVAHLPRGPEGYLCMRQEMEAGDELEAVMKGHI